MTKQAEVPIWIVRMPKPSAHEHEAPVDPIASYLTGVRNDPRKFRLRLRGQHFVGVEDEDPFITEGEVLQCPILFLGPCPIKMELHNLGAVFLRDVDRAVCSL